MRVYLLDYLIAKESAFCSCCRPRCSAAITFASRIPSPSHLGQIIAPFTVPTPLHKGHCAMFAVVMQAQYSLCRRCSEQKCTPREAALQGNKSQSRSDMFLLIQAFWQEVQELH